MRVPRITVDVMAGVGIAVVPESCSCIQIPGVVYKPLSRQTKPVELAVAFRRDEQAPAVKAFIQQIRNGSAKPTRSG